MRPRLSIWKIASFLSKSDEDNLWARKWYSAVALELVQAVAGDDMSIYFNMDQKKAATLYIRRLD